MSDGSPVLPTGDERVDAAVTALRNLETAPVDDHVAVYDDIHARLAAALAESGETPGSRDVQKAVEGENPGASAGEDG